MKVVTGRCKLQVAGCRLQVAGQDFASIWKELDSLFVLLFHTYATAKKGPEVEISVHNVFRCILTTSETITRFLLNYKTNTCTSSSINRAKAHGSAEKTSHNILETQQSSGRGG